MSNPNENTPSVTVTKEEYETLLNRLQQLETAVKEGNKSTKSQKEMTDTHALQIITGEYKELTHNKAAQQLQLSYGQIYSCRLEYTFRHIWKQIRKENPNFVNVWKK